MDQLSTFIISCFSLALLRVKRIQDAGIERSVTVYKILPAI